MRHWLGMGFLLAVAACGGGSTGGDAPPDGGGGGGGGTPATYSVGGSTTNLLPDLTVSIDVAGQAVSRLGNGPFVAPTPLVSGSRYDVRVVQAPLGRRCSVVNGSGTVAGANIDDIEIDCGAATNAVPDGRVTMTALSRRGDVVYFGGDFTRVGDFTGSLVATSPADGRHRPVITPFPGIVDALVPDGEGGHFVVLRSRVKRSPDLGETQRLLRVDASGRQVSSFQPPSFFLYAAMTAADGRLYVSGQARGSASATVLALDARTGARTSFAAVTTQGPVLDMAVANGVLYLAGAMREVNGQSRSGIAGVAADSGTLQTLAPSASSSGGQARMSRIAVAGTRLFVAGNFDVIGGVARPGLAALDAGSGSVLPWLPAFAVGNRPAITDLVASADGLWMAGGFEGRGGVVRVDPETAAVASWAVNVASVTRIALSNEAVYMAGGFETVAGQARGGLAAVRRSDAGLLAFGAGQLDAGASMISVTGDAVWVGGSFQVYGGARRPGLAAVRLSDGSLTSWAPEFRFEGRPADIYGLVDTDAGVLVAGQFTDVGGLERSGLALLDGERGTPSGWTGDLAGGSAMYLASTDTRVYVGGEFAAVGGQARTNLAAFDRQTMGLIDWSPAATAIYTLTANESTVFAADGGGLVAFDAVSGTRRNWQPDFRGTPAIGRLVATADRVHVQGNFDEIAGQRTVQGHATVDADTGGFLYSPVETVHRFIFARGNSYVLRQTEDINGITTSTLSPFDDGGVIGGPLLSIDGFVETVAFGPDFLVVGGDIGRAARPLSNLLLAPGH